MQLKLHEFDTTIFNKGCIEYLDKAENVCVTEAIDAPHSLTFDNPMIYDKAEKIIENRIVSVEGQAYRLYDVARTYSGSRMLKARARRIFFYDAEMHHIPTIGNDTDPNKSTIGVDPYVVIREAVKGTKFELIPDSELAEMGMTRLGADGLKIDFFPTDKINTYDVIKNVIEAAGKGEIYVDNFRVAVVESIGEDNGVRLTLTKNLKSLTVQYAVDDMVTRLYPYGADDLTISSVNNGVPYIDSPEAIKKYGIIEGYLDYDYTDPEKLKAHAEWDLMGEDNYRRSDTPILTLTGDMIDLSKLASYGDMEKVRLGDTVKVYDDKNMYKKRITNISYYPFENKQPTVTIGAPSIRSTFFQSWQKSKYFRTIKKNSARGNKLKTSYFTGTVNSTQNPVRSENRQLLLDGDLLYIKDDNGVRRINIGNIGKEFAFELYDKKGNRNVYINDDGDIVNAGTLDTGKDCRVQGELRVGMSGNNTKGIAFYGDAYVPDKDGNYSAPYARMLPYVANNEDFKGINVTGGKLCVEGDLVALQNDIDNLQKQINNLKKQLDTLS